MGSKILWLTTRDGNHVDLKLPFGIGLEHDPFAVGRPAGGA
jgi:hypothetical protein